MTYNNLDNKIYSLQALKMGFFVSCVEYEGILYVMVSDGVNF